MYFCLGFKQFFSPTNLIAMPPKGSKELNKKNGFLGLFQKNKKQISKMEVMILEQETELKITENQMK